MIVQGGGVIINNSSGWVSSVRQSGGVLRSKAESFCSPKRWRLITDGRASASTAFARDVDTPMLPEDARLRAWTGRPIWRLREPAAGRIGRSTRLRKPCCSWRPTIRRL